MTEKVIAPRGLPPFAYLFISMTGGISGGFVTVTLGHTLSAMGVPVAQIATMISLAVLPSTLRFLIGPLIDLTLTPLKWIAICAISIFVSMTVIAITPLSIEAMPTVDLLALILGFAGNAKVCAVAAAMAPTSRIEQRGAIAGWTNAGGLGGAGLGGGAGLWLAVHAGGVPVAGMLLAAAGAIFVLPAFWLRVPPIDHGSSVRAKVAEIFVVLWAFLRTRKGMLVVILLLVPCSGGAAIHLLPAVAKDWGVSADMVALFTGLLGAVGTMPGCVIGGYLCDRFPRREFYVWAGLAFAASEVAMVLAPHTQPWFAAMVLLNAFTLGLGFAGIAAVIYDCLGERAVATVITVLSSLCNIPLVAMTLVVGRVQTAHGSNAMLTTEAAAAVIGLSGYGALAWLWRPAALTVTRN